MHSADGGDRRPEPREPQRLETASAHFRAGRFNACEAILRTIIDRGADSAEAHNLLGFLCQRTERLDEAVDAFRRSAALRPDAPGAYNNLAAALARTGALEEAVRHYGTALRLAPHSAAIHYNKATALIALGRIVAALSALERCLACDPRYGDADRKLANILSKTQAAGHEPVIERALQRCFASTRVDYVPLARPAAQQILSKHGLA